MKSLIAKSSELLAINNSFGEAPVKIAVGKECPESTVRYMIDRHPGDPFREVADGGHFLLAAVVRNSNQYSLDFVKYVFNQNPDAARVTKKGHYSTMTLHEACQGSRSRPDVVRLVMDGFPGTLFERARDGDVPLYRLTQGGTSSVQDAEFRKTLAMVAFANPKAIFVPFMHHRQDQPSTAFSIIYDEILDVGRFERIYPELRESLWKCLYLLLNVYRFGNAVRESEAWQRPQHPVHMGTSFRTVLALL